MTTIHIEHSDRNATEYGYGLYINAVVDSVIWASECLPKDAAPEEIKKAEKRVRARARRAYNREFAS